MRCGPLAIECVEVATGEHRPLSAPGSEVLGAAECGGIRVEHLQAPQSEWPESYLRNDVIAIHLSDACPVEIWCAGTPQTRLHIPRNAISILPARMPFRCRNFAPTEAFVVEFTPDFVAAADRACERRFELQPTFGAKSPFIAQLLLALLDELRTDNLSDRVYCESVGTALVAHLSRKFARPDAGIRGGLSPRKLMLIKDYVEAHLAHELRLQVLAGLVEMNADSFLRAFKQSTGMPPHRYILCQRIERATALLRVHSLPITEIADRAGFGTQSSFTRAFRRMRGTTPRGYRSNSL